MNLRLTPRDAGRFAIGPNSLGFPLVVQVFRLRHQWRGLCVHGLFEGRDVAVSNPWDGAEWVDADSAVRLDDGDGDRPAGGAVGVVRREKWVVLTGDEADAAWLAAGAPDVSDPGEGPS